MPVSLCDSTREETRVQTVCEVNSAIALVRDIRPFCYHITPMLAWMWQLACNNCDTVRVADAYHSDAPFLRFRQWGQRGRSDPCADQPHSARPLARTLSQPQ